MRLRFLSISVLISFCLVSVSAPAIASAPSLREELLFSVVQIVAVGEDGEVSSGSGTTISKDGLVLTNYHVVADAKEEQPFSSLTICYTVSQYEPPKCAASAKIIALNKEFDLALVRPDKSIGDDGRPTKVSFKKFWKKSGNEFYAVPFKNTQTGLLPEILDQITAWGYPGVGGSTITVSRGNVSGFSVEGEAGADRILKFIKSDAAINPGNSGGAAFDEYFSFIGVPSNAWPGQLGFIIPINAIVEWFESLDRKGTIDLKKIDGFRSTRTIFSDIDAEDPLQNIALLMRHLKIMNGYGDGTFRPDQSLTNAEAIVIVVSAARLFAEKSASCFEREQTWFAEPLCYAAQAGWVDAKKFQAAGSMSEKDFFALLKKAFGGRMPKYASAEAITRGEAAYALFGLIAP